MATEQTDTPESKQHAELSAERKALRRQGRVVALLAVLLLVVGALQLKAMYDDRNTRDCLLEIASATVGTRDAAEVWLKDVKHLVNAAPEEQTQIEAQKQFNQSIDTYLAQLAAAGVSAECLDQVEEEARELANDLTTSSAGAIRVDVGR